MAYRRTSAMVTICTYEITATSAPVRWAGRLPATFAQLVGLLWSDHVAEHRAVIQQRPTKVFGPVAPLPIRQLPARLPQPIGKPIGAQRIAALTQQGEQERVGLLGRLFRGVHEPLLDALLCRQRSGCVLQAVVG